MCRVIVIPPLMKRKEVIAIIDNMKHGQEDGAGEVYLKNGQFVVNKFPYSIEKVLEKKKNFLKHLPHNGTTLLHLRSSSGSLNAKRNTHPFIIGKDKNQFALIHNGYFRGEEVARLLLEKTNQINGECDSEIAGLVLATVGVRKFSDTMDGCGVFVTMNLKGEVTIVKTSGDLVLYPTKGKKYLAASELDFDKYKQGKQVEAFLGYYKFSDKMKYLSHRQKKSNFQWIPAKTATAYEGSFGGTQKIDSTPTVTTWVHDKATGNMVRKVEKLTNFRHAGMYGEHGYNHSQGYFGGGMD